MRVRFHQNLDDLKEKLLVMAGMAEQAIQRSIEAYSTRDLSICELVFRAEPSMNRLEREIDQMALDLLAMEQPMAIDLRFILVGDPNQCGPGAGGRSGGEHRGAGAEMGAFANFRSAGRYSEAGVAGVGDGEEVAAGVYRGGRRSC